MSRNPILILVFIRRIPCAALQADSSNKFVDTSARLVDEDACPNWVAVLTKRERHPPALSSVKPEMTSYDLLLVQLENTPMLECPTRNSCSCI